MRIWYDDSPTLSRNVETKTLHSGSMFVLPRICEGAKTSESHELQYATSDILLLTSKALTGRNWASYIPLTHIFIFSLWTKYFSLPLNSLLKASLQSWHFITCRFSLSSRECVIHFILWSAEWYLKTAIKKYALLILTWSSFFFFT